MSFKQSIKDHKFRTALDNAYAAANAAQAGKVEDTRALNCGFAWVVVHDRAFMAWCRKMIKHAKFTGGSTANNNRNAAVRKYGHKHHSAGWCFWKPGDFNGQQIDIHEAGAKAFSESLAHKLQIRCEWSSRLD